MKAGRTLAVVSLSFILLSCAKEEEQGLNSSLHIGVQPESQSNDMQNNTVVNAPEAQRNSTEDLAVDVGTEPLNLTQEECPSSQVSKVTISPRGQLYINHPEVLANTRSQNNLTTGGAGKWSFAYALREILELPADPGADPVRLAAEQAAVDSFIARFGNQTVNTVASGDRSITATTLTNAWGKRTASSGVTFRWLGGAPFKLVAIVNRLDLVKKTNTGAIDATTAGEGRLVYGFTGAQAMTVIFEYNLPRADLSPIPWFQANWTNEWHKLKNFLTDTNTTLAGVQPNASLTTQPTFTNLPGYLAQLELITEKFANRRAQKRSATDVATQAAIAQIRTNEFIMSPWQIREIVRTRNASQVATLANTTVKNTPAVSQVVISGTPPINVRNDPDLGAWVDANVICSNATNLATCRFRAANGMIPATFFQNGKLFSVGPTSLADFSRWFQGSTQIKRRFMALQTCDGCHQSETGVGFTHSSPRTGEPSRFLTASTNVGGSGLLIEADLQRRANNMKNLVCLAAASTASLNLTSERSDNLDFRNPEWYSFNVH